MPGSKRTKRTFHPSRFQALTVASGTPGARASVGVLEGAARPSTTVTLVGTTLAKRLPDLIAPLHAQPVVAGDSRGGYRGALVPQQGGGRPGRPPRRVLRPGDAGPLGSLGAPWGITSPSSHHVGSVRPPRSPRLRPGPGVGRAPSRAAELSTAPPLGFRIPGRHSLATRPTTHSRHIPATNREHPGTE